MRINETIIGRSELLDIIVGRIEKEHIEDFDLLICYGSYIDGTYTRFSDIDFCFVPRNNEAYGLSSQFIIDGIGYDLWPISWERIDSIANLDESFASIVVNGAVLYANSEQSLSRFEEKKNKIVRNLSDSNLISRKSSLGLLRLKARFFDMLETSQEHLPVEVSSFFDDLLFVLSIINGKIVNKGAKAFAEEIGNFDKVPLKIVEDYRDVIVRNHRDSTLRTVKRLVEETEAIWKDCFDKGTEVKEYSSLIGFYEEMKSVYNKLIFACTTDDTIKAYHAACMIDRETQSTLLKMPLAQDYPNLAEALVNSGFSHTLTECHRHENLLVGLLAAGKVEVKTFRDIAEYAASMEKRNTPTSGSA